MSRRIYLIRHSETAWTLSQRHTGLTDIPLTKKGEEDALLIGKRLKNHPFEVILCSPLQRAKATCEKAGLMKLATIDPDLVEWNYGDYEGLTTAEIQKKSPHWNIFSNGAPGGESTADISTRASKVLKKILSFQGDVALFSHGHFLRALTAEWLGLTTREGRLFSLSPASLSILGYERETQVICLWNDQSHSF